MRYPSDVVAGALLGAASIAWAVFVARTAVAAQALQEVEPVEHANRAGGHQEVTR